MFEPLLFSCALLHAVFLFGLGGWFLRRAKMPLRDGLPLVLLFVWATLVLSGYAAGVGDHLGKLSVYAPLSLAIAGGLGGLCVVLSRVNKGPLLAAPSLPFATIETPRARKIVFWFLVGTLGLCALVSVVLGLSVYPDNADSMIYRLPRAFWYVSNGSFLHPFQAVDKRLVFYPLDGVALYVPLVLYGLPGTFHSVPSLLAWGTIVYVAYRFARELGADRLISLAAAWIVGLTPGILAQATSTNDEILAGGALLCALYCGWRWLLSGRGLYFFFAGLALGLSAGTKLHIVFLMPILLGAAAMLVVALVRHKGLAQRLARAIGGKTFLWTILAVAAMFLPFLFYNYASVGRFYFLDDFKKDVFNLHASLLSGGQNLLIYLCQMIFSPIADLNMWPVANDRQAFNNILNDLINPILRPFISDDPSFYHMSYRFVGVTLPVSVRFVEFSLWSAFVWFLWPWQSVLALRQKQFPLRGVFFLLALTPPVWLLLWSFATLYMEGTATYFTFYLICAAPAASMVFLAIRRPFWHELRWVFVIAVVITNLIVAHNLAMFSGFRALPDLVYARTWPYDWLLTEKPIIDEIRGADDIRILFTHEKQPYFGYMHWNPRAHYETPFASAALSARPDFDNILQILPISSLYMYGLMPLKVPEKPTPGVTFLGLVRGIGREAIFATGHDVDKRHPDQSNYIVLGTAITSESDGTWMLRFAEDPAGLHSEDHLTFEYELLRGDTVLYHRPASDKPAFSVRTDMNPYNDQLSLTIIVHAAWNGKELTRATYPVASLHGAWLPEGSEY